MQNITVLDKEEKNYAYSLCDSTNKKVHCFWDRHLIEGPIVKCPIRKIYKGDTRTYQSSINSNIYTIKDNLNTDNFIYETDGYFCSVECNLAFLDEEEIRNPLYKNSRQYIYDLIRCTPISAPHWRLLDVFGGPLTIADFRKSCSHKTYVLDQYTSFPICYKYKEVYHL
jgi:hypothetical protein